MKKIFLSAAMSAISICAMSQATISNNTSFTGTLPASPNQYLGSAPGINADVIIKSNGLERMRFKSSTLASSSTNPTGYVGIGVGTQNPNQGFHLHQNALRLSGNTTIGGPNILMGGTETGVSEWGIEYSPAGGLNFWKPFGCPTGAWGNYYLFLANSGKIGVNTSNPTAQLSVNGTCLVGPESTQLPAGYGLYVTNGILTSKVKVAVANTANWMDGVFEESYNLPTLNSVENYILANKHLPNIPSADEVVANGVDIAEMTAKLLGKIEELTLYMIEQEKKIEALQLETIELKKK